jgi:adenosine/AMP kinase
VEQLFHAALERDPMDREAFLKEACNGDDDLRHEVESLVAEVNRKTAFMSSPAMELAAREISREAPGALSGRRIANYQVGPLLGVGGMAEVYRGRDTDLHRDVAIKVLPGSAALDANGIARFKREGQLLASIKHPNVAFVFGLEQVDDICALVMELIEGETLSDRIVRQRPTVEEALSIAAQIAAAVEAAHSRGIIHRDLKPSNVRLTVDGEVKVLDFGIAKLLQPSPDTETFRTASSTQAATIIGTVAYMSPEQARGQKVGHSTDVWAWGCVLYEMLTGTRAFGGSGWTDMVAKIVSEDPDWTKLPADTPIAVRLLLEDCLQKDSSRRPSNISEARRRLENTYTRPAPPAASAEFALSVRSARALFLIIQFGFLTMYCAALYHGPTMVEWDTVTLRTVILTAMTGIALRLFLISSVALAHPEAGRKFNRLFPFLLFFDGAWAASPLLAVPSIRFGLALASAAGLAYLPFTQRTLIHRIYGRG